MWLPLVMTSIPRLISSRASVTARPKPPEAFSPLATTRSISCSRRSCGISLVAARRPGRPIRSPTARTLMVSLMSDTSYVASRNKKGRAAVARPFLSGVIDDPGLSDDGYLDLPWVGEFAFDALHDVARHHLGGGVVNLLWSDDDANLSPRLDRVRALDPGERIGDAFQLLQPLDVVAQGLSARPRARR